MWKEQHRPGRKRVTRRSSSSSGVVCGFSAPSRPTLKGPGEDNEEEQETFVEEEESDGTFFILNLQELLAHLVII
ncbi:hypothetical protein O181_063183 [Austropuccinia psidii MF-1]|uniref:Uncharacterized protein n=1 Tax=Austropuccinia psidii MF-1 TaxID=1389203 RepID=A0A9Q3ER55_9BASI|nr:hypothetical protein [Austropuccinia psidii MF-1]